MLNDVRQDGGAHQSQRLGRLEKEELEFEDCLGCMINMGLNTHMFKMALLF